MSQEYFPVYKGYPPLAAAEKNTVYFDAIREAQLEGAAELAFPKFFNPGDKDKKNKKGVLLIHGYTAGPIQMLELAKMFYDNGIASYCPRLRGHGTTPQDLRKRTWQEWFRDAELGFHYLRAHCDEIYVGGFSLGGTLAYFLAAEYPDIAGVFSNGAIIKVAHWGGNILRAVESLLERFNLDLGMPKVKILDETKHMAYEVYPLRSTYQILEMIDHVLPSLKNIACPILVVQSKKDTVVHAQSVKIIIERVSASKKEAVWFGDEHISLVHPDKEMYAKILNFIKG